VPKEELIWQDPVPALKKKYNAEKVKKLIAASSLSTQELSCNGLG
jgi:catalase-peroxidase